MARAQEGQHCMERQRGGTGLVAWPGVHEALRVEGCTGLAEVINIADHSQELKRAQWGPLRLPLLRSCSNKHMRVPRGCPWPYLALT